MSEWLAYSSRNLDELMARRLAEKLALEKASNERNRLGLEQMEMTRRAEDAQRLEQQRERQHAETLERLNRQERLLINRQGLEEMQLAQPEPGIVLPQGGQLRSRTTGDLLAENPMEYKPDQNERSPYFTGQAAFDPQGRPIGGMRFNTRTGEWSFEPFNGPQLKQPPGSLGQMAVTGEASIDALANLERMFNEGASKLIGPAMGRLYSAGQKTPGVPVNPQFASFEAATAAFRNAVIKSITGAQMSEPEANRIRQQIPEVTDKPEVWQEKAKQTRLNLQILNERIAARSVTPAPTGTPNPFRVRVR